MKSSSSRARSSGQQVSERGPIASARGPSASASWAVSYTHLYWVFNLVVEMILTRIEKKLDYYHD